MKNNSTLTPSEMGRKGGLATKKKHGKDYFIKINKKRWADAKKKGK